MEDTKKKKQDATEVDAAGKSLSEALETSFGILKVIMFVLVVLFLASGIRTVGSDEQALVLRFGKIRGVGEKRILGPGLKFLLPYPIHEVVKIPVEKNISLAIDSFWYFQPSYELLPEAPIRREYVKPTLDPVIDGYCITRSTEQAQISGSKANDYSIIHCKWQLIYKIDDPERFFRNVYVKDLKPGEKYFEVITESVKPLLKDLVADAVVTTMVNYTIDEALFSRQGSITNDVKELLQSKLSEIKSGIKVQSIQLDDKTWPRQVNSAFEASIQASQISQGVVSNALGYAENTLSETAGQTAEELLSIIRRDKEVSRQEDELFWGRVEGQARQIIAEARAYRKKVVEDTKANAEYLKRILPEYRKRPKLVLQKIYQDAIGDVFANADEKIIIQPTKGAKRVELRVLINRDPTLKPKSEQK